MKKWHRPTSTSPSVMSQDFEMQVSLQQTRSRRLGLSKRILSVAVFIKAIIQQHNRLRSWGSMDLSFDIVYQVLGDRSCSALSKQADRTTVKTALWCHCGSTPSRPTHSCGHAVQLSKHPTQASSAQGSTGIFIFLSAFDCNVIFPMGLS